MIPIPGGPLITEDATGVFTLVGILKAETSTRNNHFHLNMYYALFLIIECLTPHLGWGN